MTKSPDFWKSVEDEIRRLGVLDDFKCTWQGKASSYINIVHRDGSDPKKEHYEVLARSEPPAIEVALHIEQMSSLDACLKRLSPIDRARADVSTAVGRDVFVGVFGKQCAQAMVRLDAEASAKVIARALLDLIRATWPLLNPEIPLSDEESVS